MELKFHRLVKFHIPELYWEKWDKTRDEPALWPKDEVEGYIINEPHSQACADSMPDFYEIEIPYTRLNPSEVEQKLKGNENRFLFLGLMIFISIKREWKCYRNLGMSKILNSNQDI